MVDALDSQDKGVDRQWSSSGTTDIPVREGPVKQCDVKAWKATHFRSEAESLQVDKNRSLRSHEDSGWIRLAWRTSEW